MSMADLNRSPHHSYIVTNKKLQEKEKDIQEDHKSG